MYTAKLDIKHHVNQGPVIGTKTTRVAAMTLRAETLPELEALVRNNIQAVMAVESAMTSRA